MNRWRRGQTEVNSGNIHCTHIHVHRTEDRRERWRRTVNIIYTVLVHTYRYGPGDSREGGGEV